MAGVFPTHNLKLPSVGYESLNVVEKPFLAVVSLAVSGRQNNRSWCPAILPCVAVHAKLNKMVNGFVLAARTLKEVRLDMHFSKEIPNLIILGRDATTPHNLLHWTIRHSEFDEVGKVDAEVCTRFANKLRGDALPLDIDVRVVNVETNVISGLWHKTVAKRLTRPR